MRFFAPTFGATLLASGIVPRGLTLTVTNSSTNQTVVRTFSLLPVRIGRNPLNDLHIPEGFISQFHAVVELHPGNVLKLRDLGSRNGTRLGAGRAPAGEPAALGPDSSFAIGPLTFVARYGEMKLETHVSEPPPDSLPTVTRVLNPTAQPMEKTVAFDETAAAKIAEARRKLLEAERKRAREEEELNPPDSMTIDLPNSPQLMEQMMKVRQLESMALAGVRELAQLYLPNAPRLETAEDVTRFLSRLRDTMDVFLRCFIPLREGYRQFASEMDLTKTRGTGAPTAAQRVDSAANEAELAERLLDPKDVEKAALRAVEGTFADLMIHQLALLNAIMRGVKSLLTELSPPAIDQALEEASKQGKTDGWTWGPFKFKELWRIYGKKHGDMDDGDKRTFAALFGRDFASAYSQYRSDADAPEQES
jgi:type VI secretion system protein ImpI